MAHHGMFLNYGRGDITRAGFVGPNTIAQAMAQMGNYGVTVAHQNFLSGWAANFTNAYVPHRTAGTTDYLQQALDAEATSGVAIHPWIECWVRAWQDSGGPNADATLADYQAQGLLLQTLVAGDGYTTPTEPAEKMLSPANPTARALMKNAIVDMVTTHSGIKGVMIDYHRYPQYLHQGCFSAASRANFESWSGSAVASFPTDVKSGGSRYASWLAFHTYMIDSWIAELASALRAINPNILIGCTPVPTKAGREAQLQFYDHWAAAGSVDYAEPQIYTHLGGETFDEAMVNNLAAVAGTACKLYPLLYTYGTETASRDPTAVYGERSSVVNTYNCYGWSEFTWVTGYSDQLAPPPIHGYVYSAAFASATSGVTWARADIATRDGFSASGYQASSRGVVDRTNAGDVQGVPITGLASGTTYKLWSIVDNGSTVSNSGVPQSSAAFAGIWCGIGNAVGAGVTASIGTATNITITCGVGSSVAAGVNAVVNASRVIPCTVGNAAAAGVTAVINASRVIPCTVGNAAAAGVTAVINASRVIPCTVGNAAAAGVTASINESRVITCAVGNAVAAGITCAIQTSANVTVACSVGNAVAAGVSASIDAKRIIPGTVGDAVAVGISASIDQKRTIPCSVGNAAATGVSASIDQQRVITGSVGNAVAAGVTASIAVSGLTTISCSVGNAAATGLAASIDQKRVVGCSVGNAAAAGVTASVGSGIVVSALVGNASANGISATINQQWVIATGVGNALANGVAAQIRVIGPVIPTDRTYTVPAEDRVYLIIAENRTYNIVAESRTFSP